MFLSIEKLLLVSYLEHIAKKQNCLNLIYAYKIYGNMQYCNNTMFYYNFLKYNQIKLIELLFNWFMLYKLSSYRL